MSNKLKNKGLCAAVEKERLWSDAKMDHYCQTINIQDRFSTI